MMSPKNRLIFLWCSFFGSTLGGAVAFFSHMNATAETALYKLSFLILIGFGIIYLMSLLALIDIAMDRTIAHLEYKKRLREQTQ